jgi:glycosyltransferase involved in cell wall biosynthesis
LNQFRPLEESRRMMREKIGVFENDIVFGYIGRLSKEKGLDLMLQAISEIRKRKADLKVKALIVGTGEMEKNLRRLSDSLSIDCIFAGHKSNTSEWYRAMDLYFALSTRETFGLSVLEAMASGVPVMASDIPAFRRFFANNENIGYLLNRSDSDMIVNYTIKLLEDSERLVRMGKNARKQAEKYSMKDSVIILLDRIGKL